MVCDQMYTSLIKKRNISLFLNSLPSIKQTSDIYIPCENLVAPGDPLLVWKPEEAAYFPDALRILSLNLLV